MFNPTTLEIISFLISLPVLSEDGGEIMSTELLTVAEVAKILKCNVDYVYKLKKSGLLRFMKLGNLKCRRESLEEFLSTYDGKDVTDPFNVKEL